MSQFFYVFIILIVSPTELQVIHNKVSLDEFQAYKSGFVEKRKSFPNSTEGILSIEKSINEFSNNRSAKQVFFNLSAKEQGGGSLMESADILGKIYTQADIEAFAKERNKTEITDALFAEFAQEKTIKNIPRKK